MRDITEEEFIAIVNTREHLLATCMSSVLITRTNGWDIDVGVMGLKNELNRCIYYEKDLRIGHLDFKKVFMYYNKKRFGTGSTTSTNTTTR